MRLDAALPLAELGAKNAGALRREYQINISTTPWALASRTDLEVFYVEQLGFRPVGFGGVFDLPRKTIADLMRTGPA